MPQLGQNMIKLIESIGVEENRLWFYSSMINSCFQFTTSVFIFFVGKYGDLCFKRVK